MYEWNQNLHTLRDHAQRCGTTITTLKQDLNRQLGELAKASLNLPQERFRLSQALVKEYLGEELDETSFSLFFILTTKGNLVEQTTQI